LKELINFIIAIRIKARRKKIILMFEKIKSLIIIKINFLILFIGADKSNDNFKQII
jgi:hypothetical protein